MRSLAALVLAMASLSCGGSQSGGAWSPQGSCEVPRAPRAGELDRLDAFPGGGEPRVLEVDLDGDRAADRLVSETGLCDRFGNCGYRIYLMRGSCGHALGSIWAASARTGVPSSGPLADLVATTRDAKGEFAEWYRFDDGKLVCAALRERQLYRAGRLDPQAPWGPWEGCE